MVHVVILGAYILSFIERLYIVFFIQRSFIGGSTVGGMR